VWLAGDFQQAAPFLQGHLGPQGTSLCDSAPLRVCLEELPERFHGESSCPCAGRSLTSYDASSLLPAWALSLF
jgi:hypothetical protein